jgi:hypothetical protein
MPPYHYPRSEDAPQASLQGLSEEARDALGGLSIDASPAGQLLNTDHERQANDSFELALGLSLEASHVICDRVAAYTPSMEEFKAAGVNFGKLFQAFETMDKADFAPAIVFAPTLSLEDWQAVYQQLAELYINFGLTDDPQIFSRVSHGRFIADRKWNVLVMPTDPKAYVKKEPYTNSFMESSRGYALQALVNTLRIPYGDSINPSMHAYLMLQAMSYSKSGSYAIDGDSFTWLESDLQGKRRAGYVTGTTCRINGKPGVSLGLSSSGDTDSNRGGIRPTVWECNT